MPSCASTLSTLLSHGRGGFNSPALATVTERQAARRDTLSSNPPSEARCGRAKESIWRSAAERVDHLIALAYESRPMPRRDRISHTLGVSAGRRACG